MNGKSETVNILRARYVGMDLFTTFLAFLLFNYFRFTIGALQHVSGNFISFMLAPKMLAEQFCLPLVLLGIYWLSGYYNDPFTKSRLVELSQTFFSTLFNSVLIYLALLINDQFPGRSLNYEIMVTLFLLMFGFVYLGRVILTNAVINKIASGEWSFNTVIIGNSDKAIDMARRLNTARTNVSYNVIGHLPIHGETPSPLSHHTLTDNQLDRLCRMHKIDQLIICAATSEESTILTLLNKYFPSGTPIKISPHSLSFLTSHIRQGDINAEPFIDITSASISPFQKNMKRVLDILLSSVALILGSPVFLAVAIGVKLSSPGPVIYRQPRVGYRQKRFNILKFRSMYQNAESKGPQLSDIDDPRITPLGHILRKYRLDEIPQFWNVVKGDMSLVGPRPERDFFIRQIVEKAPFYSLLHQVKPGLTSWGMVKFGYAKSVDEMIERSRFDLIYLSNMSLAVDFKILLHTLKTIAMGKGV